MTLAALAAAALPIFGLARQKGLPDAVAFAVAALFLFNPFLTDTFFMYGFRPECLMVPFLLAAGYFLERKKPAAAQLCLVLVLLTKHDSVILLASLGLVLAAFRPGLRRFGAANIILAAAYYLLVVRPLFNHFAYSPTAHFKTLAPWGDTAAAALLNLGLHPGLILEQVSGPEARFVLTALASVGFLCLLSPLVLVAAPFVVINLMGNDFYSLISGWHWAVVAPVLYLAAVDGLARLKTWARSPGWRKAGVAALVLVLAWEGMTTARFALTPNPGPVDQTAIARALAVIPPDAPVSASYRLLWPLAFRPRIYSNSTRVRLDVDYVAILRALPPDPQHDRALLEAMQDPTSPLFTEFAPVLDTREVLVLKRKAPPAGR